MQSSTDIRWTVSYNELTIFARRWHGFARWRLCAVAKEESGVEYRFHPIAQGWMRVPRQFNSPMTFIMGAGIRHAAVR